MTLPPYPDRRKALLLRLVQDGVVNHWRDACMVLPNLGWPTIRRVLKQLRDEGKINTDREYSTIEPKL